MPKRLPRGGVQADVADVSATCKFCDPPEAVKAALGSAIGQYRHQHYLTFPTNDALAQHLKTFVQPFPPPDKGYVYDQWLHGVLAWHRQQLIWRSQDAKRGLDETQHGPDTVIENGSGE